MNYIIIQADRISKLNKEVCEAIREGFIPSGGICFDGKVYLQAVVKKEVLNVK